jgi:ankyrin repeat protein
MNAKQIYENTLLHTITSKRHSEEWKIERIRLLISHGADPNAEVDGTYPIVKAAFMREYKIVELLLDEYGVDLAKADTEGNTALMFASFDGDAGNANVIDMMLMRGGTDAINLENKNGDTALMIAAYNGNSKAAHLLVGYGALAGKRNKKGIKASEYAERNGFHELANFLKIEETREDMLKKEGRVHMGTFVEAKPKIALRGN